MRLTSSTKTATTNELGLVRMYAVRQCAMGKYQLLSSCQSGRAKRWERMADVDVCDRSHDPGDVVDRLLSGHGFGRTAGTDVGDCRWLCGEEYGG